MTDQKCNPDCDENGTDSYESSLPRASDCEKDNANGEESCPWRPFSASLGIVPREHSSGLRQHLGAITKRGDPYLRTLLIYGARSVLLAASRAKHPDRLQAWALRLQHRRGHNRAAVALANKLARIVWAVSAHQTEYRRNAA